MPDLVFLALVELGFAQVDVVFQRQLARLGDRPDGAADGRQRRDDAIEHRVVELLRADLGLGNLGDLAHQIANLLFCLFNEFRVDGLFSAHAISPRSDDNASPLTGPWQMARPC